jgi:hypothetical protein
VKLLLFVLASLSQQAYGQVANQGAAKLISLDTVAVTGQIRQLTLLPLGAKPSALGGFSLSPAHRVAIRYQPPTTEHEYDIRSVTLHFNTLFNSSSTGRVQVQLALPDSSGAPASTYLLPTPFILTAQQVRRARQHTITLSVQGNHLALPPSGIFVVLTGLAAATEQFISDTLISQKHAKGQQSYVKMSTKDSRAYRLVSQSDFLTLPIIYTTQPPVTWSWWKRDQQWHRLAFSVASVPQYRPFNYWVELGVTEL